MTSRIKITFIHNYWYRKFKLLISTVQIVDISIQQFENYTYINIADRRWNCRYQQSVIQSNWIVYIDNSVQLLKSTIWIIYRYQYHLSLNTSGYFTVLESLIVHTQNSPTHRPSAQTTEASSCTMFFYQLLIACTIAYAVVWTVDYGGNRVRLGPFLLVTGLTRACPISNRSKTVEHASGVGVNH